MSSHQNYLHLFSQYRVHRETIEQLIESITTSITSAALLDDYNAQIDIAQHLSRQYPFVELLYSVDAGGIQKFNTAFGDHVSERNRRSLSQGSDRSERPYFKLASTAEPDVVMTEPYLSSATHKLSISGVHRFSRLNADTQKQEVLGYLIVNFNLERLISFLNGDEYRRKIHPLFQFIYGIIGGMLILVAGLLVYSAGDLFVGVLYPHRVMATEAFGIVILVTLGLAIFDLGKTIIEEEVLLHKDIHHDGSTRRTITRFMAAILIAVSIESLLLMFKSLLGETGQLQNAVWMLLGAVGLLIGLGIYLKLSRE
ncbi:hypothetical protein BTA51_24795 [Hahella sp. CCB-MM4]|uniref:hypothetical protein n=1 Tax=Hahella sp. (strain CCB-MM4) TaxID=1926491 RepID=UPI000B9B5181|nr:hypothetical protein [Hahella sp. CCB-MM4]OZG70588.1 hypothetical protein BTA51_24795 [Hahella sp. CCB-MM4]